MNRKLSSILMAFSFCAACLLLENPRAQAALAATTTTLTSSVNPVVIGQPVTYTVTVTASGGVPLTGPVSLSFNGNFIPLYALNNGSVVVTTTASGPPQTLQVIASYLGDANTAASTSATLSEVVTAGVGLTPASIAVVMSVNPAYPYQTVTYTAAVTGGTTPTGTVNFYLGSTTPFPATLSGGVATVTNAYPAAGNYPISATYSGDSHNQGATSPTIEQVIVAAAAQPPLQFVPITPCRVVDTRNALGPLGGPPLASGQTRNFAIPQGACGIPTTAAAYSLNVTAVPNGPLGYITVWPTGVIMPTVSLLNSFDGRVKANAAIVPAGTGGAVSVFATGFNTSATVTNIVLDIDGYFAPPNSTSLAFYPITPCRTVDTRNAAGPLGGPYIAAGQARSFPLLSSTCNIPTTAQAYSLNVTAIPAGPLGYLTVWPTGVAQPAVSTLNALTGTITANAAIVPAGSSGAISVYVQNDSDVLLDVNGYFAPPGVGGTSLYTTTPCRVFDSRNFPYPPFPGTFTIATAQSYCTLSNAAAAYVLNATVVPSGVLNYLALWAAGTSQPLVSTLNAFDGAVTSNMAIVPTNNNDIDAYASQQTQMILDVSSYFAP
jgi:Bacterial Ig-like domain (group 3)